MTAAEIEAVGISKSFSGVQALCDVDLALAPHEARGLVGGNGAGKSTLVKILSGAMQPDSGVLKLRGEEVTLRRPHDAIGAGIGTVHQRNNLVPSLTVLQNVELGHERTRAGWLAPGAGVDSLEALDLVGLGKRRGTPVRSLSLADRQLVAIARAVSRSNRMMIFDEPTAVLSMVESEALFKLIDRLREAGTAILYVTHRLEELPDVCTEITVMRDGQIVDQVPSDLAEDELVRLISGAGAVEHEDEQRHAAERRAASRPADAASLLRVEELTDRGGAYSGVGFDLRAGEVLALVGLPDSGVPELVETLVGSRPPRTGLIELAGKALDPRSPRRMRRSGIGYLTGDRAERGIIPTFSVRQTATLSAMGAVSSGTLIRPGRERALAADFLTRCKVRAASEGMPISALSGGNQQKALLARSLAASPRVLVCEDATAGVDVAGREALYDLVAEACAAGHGVIWTSSELREVTTIADRALVMWRGSIVAEVRRDGMSEPALMAGQFNQSFQGNQRPGAEQEE